MHRFLLPAATAALAALLTACTIYEAPPGGQVTVVPGYDYAAHQNADDSDTPPDAMPNNALQ